MTGASTTERFLVEFDEGSIDELRQRLRRTTWPLDRGNEDWAFGVNGRWLQDAVGYWAEEYDWLSAQLALNTLPHYRTTVDTVPLHFVHIRGGGERPLPVVLTHGWPWTFWDWHRVAQLLTQHLPNSNGWDCIDIVIPSLPGFTFSRPGAPIQGITHIAALWAKLMTQELGYPRFLAVGGDWGALVTAQLARAEPLSTIGIVLLTATHPGIDRASLEADLWAPNEQWMLRRMAQSASKITAHASLGRHAPQTLSVALTDSPAGAAAWLWGPRHDWTSPRPGWPTDTELDFLCTTASLYWMTGTAGSAMRLYADEARHPTAPWQPERLRVPTSVVVSPEDVVFAPRTHMAQRFDLRRWTVLPSGGHFAAAENPRAIAEEIVAFARELNDG